MVPAGGGQRSPTWRPRRLGEVRGRRVLTCSSVAKGAPSLCGWLCAMKILDHLGRTQHVEPATPHLWLQARDGEVRVQCVIDVGAGALRRTQLPCPGIISR